MKTTNTERADKNLSIARLDLSDAVAVATTPDLRHPDAAWFGVGLAYREALRCYLMREWAQRGV